MFMYYPPFQILINALKSILHLEPLKMAENVICKSCKNLCMKYNMLFSVTHVRHGCTLNALDCQNYSSMIYEKMMMHGFASTVIVKYFHFIHSIKITKNDLILNSTPENRL